jgi:hypothetical protein
MVCRDRPADAELCISKGQENRRRPRALSQRCRRVREVLPPPSRRPSVPVVFRHGDPIRPDDDVVLRAGGGQVENLVRRAVENAPDYASLVAAGYCRSPYTISVHVPRHGRATKDEILASPGYAVYKPYLEADAAELLALVYVEVVATTVVSAGVEASGVDLCHYDVVVAAGNDEELRERLAAIRERFVRDDNPAHRR